MLVTSLTVNEGKSAKRGQRLDEQRMVLLKIPDENICP